MDTSVMPLGEDILFAEVQHTGVGGTKYLSDLTINVPFMELPVCSIAIISPLLLNSNGDVEMGGFQGRIKGPIPFSR